MKRNFFTAICMSFIFTGLLVACLTVSPAPTPSPIPIPPKWIMDWLENPVCSPPCWQGIQPGLTSVEIAKDFQKEYPDMSFDSKRGTSVVQIVKLHLSLYDTLPLSMLISKYGDPSHVRIFKCDPNGRCETHVIFGDKGMVFNLYLKDEGRSDTRIVTISASSNILKIYFIDFGLHAYFDIPGFSGDPNSDLIPWEGLKQYSQYNPQ